MKSKIRIAVENRPLGLGELFPILCQVVGGNEDDDHSRRVGIGFELRPEADDGRKTWISAYDWVTELPPPEFSDATLPILWTIRLGAVRTEWRVPDRARLEPGNFHVVVGAWDGQPGTSNLRAEARVPVRVVEEAARAGSSTALSLAGLAAADLQAADRLWQHGQAVAALPLYLSAIESGIRGIVALDPASDIEGILQGTPDHPFAPLGKTARRLRLRTHPLSATDYRRLADSVAAVLSRLVQECFRNFGPALVISP